MNRILIVDDKQENLYMLRFLLESNGYEVDEARHGAEALLKARQLLPQLVISDLLMPIMDGYTLLRHWKSDGLLSGIPFVVYTATYTEPKDEKLALDLGADAFIIKPIEPEPFLHRIQEVLARQKNGFLTRLKLPTGNEQNHLQQYNEALIRKLEEKTLQLEQANRDLKQDNAEREKLQAQLIQAQKMESVGRLAGGVAHDFNNMLGIILGYSELALERGDLSEKLANNFQEIHNAAIRAAEITKKLLAFARKQTINPRVLDLNETVESMLKMLRRLIGEDIDLAWLPASGLWPVMADPSQIDQILANLCVNARDAIVGTGKITIETGMTTLDDAYCSEHAGFLPGAYTLLAVSDNGCGMPPEVLSHLFEPFFTTKEVGKGTGLGLATVYGIVKQNNGFINVYSEPERGTTFRIYFPRHMGEKDRITVQDAGAIPRGNGEITLVVEDDPAILLLAQTMLSGLGFKVLEASTPLSALKLAKDHSGAISLLLTDVVMPEMDGRELAHRMQAIHPETRVLFMSGYTADTIAHHGVLDEGIRFLQKPFSIRDIACKVRQTLDGE